MKRSKEDEKQKTKHEMVCVCVSASDVLALKIGSTRDTQDSMDGPRSRSRVKLISAEADEKDEGSTKTDQKRQSSVRKLGGIKMQIWL